MQTIVPANHVAETPRPVNRAKIYLRQYRDIEGNVYDHVRKYNICRNSLEKISDAFERATRATSTLTAVRISGTPQHDSMANAVLEMVRLKDFVKQHRGDYDGVLDYLLDDLARLAQAGADRLSLISTLSDERYKRLLFLRYICGKRWEAIAHDMGYGVDNIYKLHGKALHEANQKITA